MRPKYNITTVLLILVFLCFAVSKNGGGIEAWAKDSSLMTAMASRRRAKASSIGQRFLGERLDYHLGVFWLSRIADCVISFKQDKKSGRYVAIMWAKTRGVVGWLTDYRENRYISHMEEINGGRRLRPTMFERMVTIGNLVHQSISCFDYQDQQIDYTIIRNHRVIEQNCYDIPEGVIYEDILSAFYNSRAEVFGEVKKGEYYEIPSIPDKGIDRYTVKVLDDKQDHEQRRKQGWEAGTGYVLKVRVDKDIFGTKEGLFWVWMSEDLIPIIGVAEDAIGLGDVIGQLKRLSYDPEQPEQVRD